MILKSRGMNAVTSKPNMLSLTNQTSKKGKFQQNYIINDFTYTNSPLFLTHYLANDIHHKYISMHRNLRIYLILIVFLCPLTGALDFLSPSDAMISLGDFFTTMGLAFFAANTALPFGADGALDVMAIVEEEEVTAGRSDSRTPSAVPSAKRGTPSRASTPPRRPRNDRNIRNDGSVRNDRSKTVISK